MDNSTGKAPTQDITNLTAVGQRLSGVLDMARGLTSLASESVDDLGARTPDRSGSLIPQAEAPLPGTKVDFLYALGISIEAELYRLQDLLYALRSRIS